MTGTLEVVVVKRIKIRTCEEKRASEGAGEKMKTVIIGKQ